MRLITYSLQFRGRAKTARSNRLQLELTAPSSALVTTVGPDGVRGAFKEVPGEEARCEAELCLEQPSTFDDSGTIEFGRGNSLRFHSVGAGRLAACPDPNLRHGTVVREVDGGKGQFDGAEGLITSNFFVSDTGEVTDNQLGLIFVRERRPGEAADRRERSER